MTYCIGHLLSEFAERRLACDTSVMDKALRVIGRLIAFDVVLEINGEDGAGIYDSKYMLS